MTVILYKCFGCAIEKGEDSFYPSHLRRGRVRLFCRACCLEYERRRLSLMRTDPEKLQAYLKRRLVNQRRSYKRKRLSRLAYMKKYRRDRPGEAEQWRKDNPERWYVIQKEAHRRRRARVWGSRGSFSEGEWRNAVTLAGNKCLRCWAAGTPTTLEPDHVISLAQGGTNTIDNIQPLCPKCNGWKRATTIDYRFDRFAPMVVSQ